MTWCKAQDAKMKATDKWNPPTKLGKHGRHLKLRSWDVTTLHHYKRISSRDLGWHRRETGKGRGKTNWLLWQTSETKEPCEVEQIERKNTMKMNKVENTPLEGGTRNLTRTLEIAKLWMTSTMEKKELKPLWLKRDKQGTRKNKFEQHSGWKEIQDLIRWKELE